MKGGRVLLLVVLASATVVAAAPQEQPTFRAGVEGVRIDVLATHDGRPVAGLTADDFEVLDDGVAQRVTVVDVGKVPVDLVLVLDTSESVQGPRLQALIRACRSAAGALRPIDRAAVVTFSNAVTEVVALTGDHQRLTVGLDQLSAAGGTSLYDAAYAGLLLGEGQPARTLLLVFSDGRDTASWLPASAVLEAARRSNVIAYTVTTEPVPRSRVQQQLHTEAPYLLRPTPGTGRYAFGGGSGTAALTRASRGFLGRLVELTGGRLLGSSDPDLAKRFVDIVQEFQNRYVLAYTPTGVDKPGWHDVTVRVRKKGVDVHARRGYWR